MDIIGAIISVAEAKYDEQAGQMRVIVESQVRSSGEPEERAVGLVSVATLHSNGLLCVKADGGSAEEATKALGRKVLQQGDASVALLKDRLETLRGIVGE